MSRVDFKILGLSIFHIAFLAFTSVATAADSATRDTHIAGSADMHTYFINEAYEEARSVGIGLNFTIDHRLSDTLSAKISVNGNFDIGSSQDTFNSEYKPTQGFVLNEASLNWRATNNFNLRGGAINQQWLESPLLIGNVAFPAAFAGWQGKWKNAFIELNAEAAIPTSDTTHSIPQGNEPLPTANFGRVTLGLKDADSYTVKAHVGHYDFNNLPSGVASQSRIRGNSVPGVGDQGSYFKYDFSGVETGASAEGKIAERWSTKLDGTYLTNLRAPVNQSRGTRIALEASYRASDSLIISPTIQWFRNESDSAPAYYDIQELAHNNREGFGVGARVILPLSRLEISGSWVHANVIDPNPAQSKFSGVLFSIGKSYDFL